MSVSINGTNGLTFSDSSVQSTAATGFGFKNRIINGAMMIDQRNAGASVTITSDSQYTLDRWRTSSNQASKFAFQQNRNNITPPAGFNNYLGVSVLSPVTVGASDYFGFLHAIEGYNVADLDFGLSTASSVVLSFWVNSSVTGTYSVAFQNSFSVTRSYVTTYSIPVANTWTKVSLTIPGDVTGTWVRNNMAGIVVYFSLGMGSNFNTTTNTWTSTGWQASSQTQWIANSGATFYITGVQLEKGSTATSFDYRPYGTELALCQRYYQKGYFWGSGNGDLTNLYFQAVNLPVSMRAQPSVTNDADSSGIVANGNLYNLTAGSANIPNSWWYGASGYISVTTNAQITRWTTASGRIANLQLNAEL